MPAPSARDLLLYTVVGARLDEQHDEWVREDVRRPDFVARCAITQALLLVLYAAVLASFDLRDGSSDTFLPGLLVAFAVVQAVTLRARPAGNQASTLRAQGLDEEGNRRPDALSPSAYNLRVALAVVGLLVVAALVARAYR